MALSPRQIQLIQRSFSKVAPIADDAAAIFYRKLFSYDPNLRQLFKHDMKSQGRKLMSTLKVAVNGLNDLDALVPVLEKLAIKHLDYGVEIHDYTPVGNALINTLRVGLGKEFTGETKQAWIDLYTLIAHVMRSAAYPEYHPETYRNLQHYNH